MENETINSILQGLFAKVFHTRGGKMPSYLILKPKVMGARNLASSRSSLFIDATK